MRLPELKELVLETERSVKIGAFLVITAAVVAAGVFALTGSQEGALYMRGDSHTVNGFSAFRLNGTQSSNSQSDFVEKSDDGTSTVYWGSRYWVIDENGTETEITSGSPVAVVSRSSDGSGIQSETYNPPETDVNPGDAMVARVYISVGSNDYQQRAEFVTPVLNASKILNRTWTVNYYTERTSQSGGPPFNRFTRGTFYWGSSTYNSRIEGFNYSLARVEGEQLSPKSEVDTYPGNEFSHEVEVTCRASSCKDVTAYPQVCQSRSCTSFSNIDGSEGISWNKNSHSFGDLSRDQTASYSFTANPEDEGEYRVRFNITSPGIINNQTSSEVVDVDVADVNLTSLEHENKVQNGIAEYETSDNISYVNTSLTAGGGTAFNVTSALTFTEPDQETADWGPSSRKSLGNLSDGETGEARFSSYEIPLDADTGRYNFTVDYDWENTGPETNSSITFRVVDVRGTFVSSLDDSSVLGGTFTRYRFNLTNRWSTSISDVNVSVNCRGNISCDDIGTSYFSSLSSGEKAQTVFNVSTQNSEPGFYDINATVNYTNPGEEKDWKEVENEVLKISEGGTLVTTIENYPDRITRGEKGLLNGSLENTGDPASDVYLNWSLPGGWTNSSGNLSRFENTVDSGEIIYNNITASTDVTADRGKVKINLTSNSSAGDRGDFTFKEVEVYANTSSAVTLNTSDAARGEAVKATLELELDTGADLKNQDISFRDEYSGDFLGSSATDSLGVAEKVFTVPDSWNVTQHPINGSYSGNSTIYTNPSSGDALLDVHDIPLIANVTAEPETTGYGFNVSINASVKDEDGVKDVNLTVETPSGSSEVFDMKNISGSYYGYNYSQTWENGDFSYRIEAADEAGYRNSSSLRTFTVTANATKNVVTDRDSYGPNEDVLLERSINVTRNGSVDYSSLASRLVAENVVSDSFDTLTGTSGVHTNTHELDSVYFNMTERDGSPPSTPDEFEGIYTYKTSLDSFDRIDINSYGRVSGGSWDVQFRNYATDSFDTAFTISETSNVWDNTTFCSGSACDDYVRNGEIEVRVFTQSDRGTAEDKYSVDFQQLRIEGNSTEFSKTDDPESSRVGKDKFRIKRLYRNFELSELPYFRSANLKGAELVFNVTGGFGTGEVYHTKNFSSGSTAEEIYRDGPPQESTAARPIDNFSTSEGFKRVDVTKAVNDSFEAGKRYVGFQFREQDEDTYYELDENAYLVVNYTAESEIFDTGTTDIRAYLVMRVQRKRSDGSWENVGFPVVDRSNGVYRVNSGSSLDLASIWESNGAFDTGLKDPGTYRVLSRFVDPDGNTLVTDEGERIRDTYEFLIRGAQLNLTDIEHENQEEYAVNEYETRDNLEFVNVTINNSQEEAVNATIDLETLDENNETTQWGPNSLKICGDIAAGGSCEKRWDNSTSGYTIPESASSGTFTFRWNATLDAENFQKKSNYSVTFVIHDVPSDFSSVIQDSDNKIIRNESTLYNFTIANPWSGPLEQLNVTVNCDSSELNCRQKGTSNEKAQLGTLSSGTSEEVSFNITTDENTAVDDYDINATVEYINPGTERRVWRQRRNKILQVRIPGALLNITKAPEKVIRGDSGYRFESYNNNTFDENLTNSSTSWSLPPGWNNQSGNLDAFDEVQEPAELLYNNFTAEVDISTELGETRINLSATNDQGRIDNDFVRIDVYADTSTELKFNESDPAVDEPVTLTGFLEYGNGSAVKNQELNFRDETEGTDIGSGTTNSSGGVSLTYQPDQPLGNHTINVSFGGSKEDYLEPSFAERNLTVHDRPNVTNVSATPEIVGFGFNTTINASVKDEDGVDNVDLEVTYPNGTEFSFPMKNTAGSVYEANFTETWTYGTYLFDVVATDSFNKTSSNSSSFAVFIKQQSTIQTERFDYFPDEFVNLTDRDAAWWDTDYDYRRKIQVNETSGNDLVKYPTRLEVENLGSKVQPGCEDLRVVEDFVPKDIYIESCNPSGTTELYLSNNVTASSTEEDVYLYYGNSTKEPYGEEIFAYPINASGVYDPGKTTIDNTQSYNGENSTFRQIEITVFGDSLSAKVEAYNFRNNTWITLFEGNPSSGETIVDRFILQDPRFNKVNVQLEDTSNNPSDVSYEYNYTTPDYTDAEDFSEQDKLPSIIRNTGNTSFRGRIELLVETNVSGTWEFVKTQYNETNPSELLTGNSINFASLWNDNPFYTDTREEGFYRAKFRLESKYGEILSDGVGKIVRDYVFRLNGPQTEVNVENIKVYNVTGAADQTEDTSDLEDSGLNSTLTVKGGETYRFDVTVNNSESAGASWKIEEQDLVKHFNFNETWNIDENNEIFYTNNTQEYVGGLFTGDVKWNTSAGLVKPGRNATFSFVVEIPNKGENRGIEFRINDTAFLERDYSKLEVVKKEQNPPNYLDFDINDSLVTRGEPFLGYAKWSEEIDSASAEYNSTTSVLNNFTVTPEGVWTNKTTDTASDWKRGNHTFRFYASDANGNQNKTYQEVFSVLGIASITGSDTNTSTVEPGEPVRFSCQVGNDRDNAISGYNVSFFNETSKIGFNSTNSTGGASIAYSSEDIGFQDLKCEIQRNLKKFYDVGDPNSTETIRVAENEAPDYFEYGANRSRVFKTTQNDTIKFFSNWTDNKELDFASLNNATSDYSGNLPESEFDILELSGTQDWANFTIDIPEGFAYEDRNWSIYANDTSSNINSTAPIRADIWAYAFIDDSESGADKNPVGVGEEFTFFCNYKEGNGTGIPSYNVSFYDNDTSDGSFQKLGVNDTQQGSEKGFAQWTKSYSETGAYEIRCSTSESFVENVKPFSGFKNFSETIKVKLGDVLPPYLVDGTYSINDSAVYKGFAPLKSTAKWNDTISWAKAELNTTSNALEDRKIPEPYTANWTNYSFQPQENWTVGTHYIKTYANDTDGNLNDSLQYLKFDIWGYSNVSWQEPTGDVVKSNNTELVCRVGDNQTAAPLESYQVSFYDDNNSLIGTNITGSNGEASYYYDTSDLPSGERTWSCGIGDEQELFYNASADDLDSETVNLVNEANGVLSGNLTDPLNNTVLAQNKTFTANVSVKCTNADCGDVDTTLRYNETGASAGTKVSSSSDRPFYTIGSNPKTCDPDLKQGDTCFTSWQVNATGKVESLHALDAQLNGSTASTNDTEDKRATIDIVLIFNLNYTGIDFPAGAPSLSSPNYVEAPNNSDGKYFAELDEDSNDATGGVWIKGTGLNHTGSSAPDYRRFGPENTTYTVKPSCSYAGSDKIFRQYTKVLDFLESGGNFTNCFFQEIPQAKAAGIYKGNITIKVNATN